MKKVTYLFFILTFLVFGCKVGQKKEAALTEQSKDVAVNLSGHKPIVNSIVGKYNFIDSSAIKVFLKINITEVETRPSIDRLNQLFRAKWTILTAAGIKEKLEEGKIILSQEYVTSDNEFDYKTFTVPKVKGQDEATLLIDFIHAESGTKFTYDINLDFAAQRTNTRYEIYDKTADAHPRFKPYIPVGQEFVIKSIKPSSEPLFLIQYRNNTKPALSPMSNTQRESLSEFEIVKSIPVSSGTPLVLHEMGMYALTQNPENVNDGYGFLVVNDRYPRDTNPETLKEALAYMSTSKEMENTVGNSNSKDGLDLYFLNLAKGNEELAKKIIRSYYKRVEEANEIFTNYKEGWKTDKGMVYIIMGPPTRVQRNRQREVWLYPQSKNTSEIIYTFYKKTNVFSEQYYELVRYPEYSAFWYPYVEAWRTGKVTE